jgi:hypothetical protein
MPPTLSLNPGPTPSRLPANLQLLTRGELDEAMQPGAIGLCLRVQLALVRLLSNQRVMQNFALTRQSALATFDQGFRQFPGLTLELPTTAPAASSNPQTPSH